MAVLKSDEFDNFPGTQSWLEYLQGQYDDIRHMADEARRSPQSGGCSQAHELDHRARIVISLLKKPFYGIVGHEDDDPVPTLNRWLHSRGLPSIDVHCSHCGNLRSRLHPDGRCPFPARKP